MISSHCLPFFLELYPARLERLKVEEKEIFQRQSSRMWDQKKKKGKKNKKFSWHNTNKRLSLFRFDLDIFE